MSALTIELDGTGAPAPPPGRADAERADADRVEIGRDDMIGALGHADDLARLRLGVDELGLRLVALGHVDRERRLGRIDRLVAERAADPQARPPRSAGVRRALLGPEGQALGRAGEAESDMDDVVAGRQGQGRLRRAPIRPPAGASRPPPACAREHAPAQAASAARRRRAIADRLSVACRRRLVRASAAPARATSRSQRHSANHCVTSMPSALPRAARPRQARRALVPGRQWGGCKAVYSRSKCGQEGVKRSAGPAPAQFRDTTLMNDTIDLLARRRSAPPPDLTGPGPDAGRARDDPAARLARARSRQARAVALRRVRGRGARTGRADRARDPARRQARPRRAGARGGTDAASRARRSSSRSSRARRRMRRSPNGSRCFRPARRA